MVILEWLLFILATAMLISLLTLKFDCFIGFAIITIIVALFYIMFEEYERTHPKQTINIEQQVKTSRYQNSQSRLAPRARFFLLGSAYLYYTTQENISQQKKERIAPRIILIFTLRNLYTRNVRCHMEETCNSKEYQCPNKSFFEHPWLRPAQEF